MTLTVNAIKTVPASAIQINELSRSLRGAMQVFAFSFLIKMFVAMNSLMIAQKLINYLGLISNLNVRLYEAII